MSKIICSTPAVCRLLHEGKPERDRSGAQRCFAVAPVDFARGPLYPAVGAYLINGRFVGYYSRVAPAPFLTHQATYVPTVIDDQ